MGAITSKVPAQKPAVVAGLAIALFVTSTIGAFGETASLGPISSTWWGLSGVPEGAEVQTNFTGPIKFVRWMSLFAFLASLFVAFLAARVAFFADKVNLPAKFPPTWVFAAGIEGLHLLSVFGMLFSDIIKSGGVAQTFLWLSATIFGPAALIFLKKQDEEGADGGADAAAPAGDFSDAATAGAV